MNFNQFEAIEDKENLTIEGDLDLNRTLIKELHECLVVSGKIL